MSSHKNYTHFKHTFPFHVMLQVLFDILKFQKNMINGKRVSY